MRTRCIATFCEESQRGRLIGFRTPSVLLPEVVARFSEENKDLNGIRNTRFDLLFDASHPFLLLTCALSNLDSRLST